LRHRAELAKVGEGGLFGERGLDAIADDAVVPGRLRERERKGRGWWTTGVEREGERGEREPER
jgi:hypothetical protein